MQEQPQPQEYDATLKALFGSEAATILSTLLPSTILLSDHNIEIDRTMLKADLAYRVKYKGRLTILNVELQSSPEKKIVVRLLQYSVALHAKYGLPVISLLIYLFETEDIVVPPYQISCGDEVIILYYYQVICLWLLEAEEFVGRQEVALYTLLPGMHGATAALLKEALREMAWHYPRAQFQRHLVRFHRIMWRANTMILQEKRMIDEELRVHYEFDALIDENPEVIKRTEKKHAEGLLEGRAEGELQGLRKMILKEVEARFPDLKHFAQQQVEQIQDFEALLQLSRNVILSSNKMMAYDHLLTSGKTEVQE